MDKSEILLLDKLEQSHWWYQARKHILDRILSDFQRPLKILDLGSASGGNTLTMLEKGFEVVSVEYSDIGVEIQRKKGIEVIQADACSLPFLNETFDVVVCLDVLEHITEDSLALVEISRVLRTGGRFIFSVPEGKKLWSAHDVAVSHVRRYEKCEFQQKIEAANLKLDSIWSRNVFLKPIAIIVRKFAKGSSLKPVLKPLNAILLTIALVEDTFVINQISGMTIWAVGSKES